MSERVAVLIVNYNMPERADEIAAAVGRSSWPCDAILIDNGSDIMPPAKHTTLQLEKNVQTTRGWLAGLAYAREHGPYFAYMFCITSAEWMRGDPVAACAQVLADDPNAVGAHPALTPDSTTAWHHLKARGGAVLRPTWMIDNISSMYRADWFDAAQRFDPRLIYGHGIDLEACWMARKEGRGLWVTEAAGVRKITDIGYSMNRMNMTADERNRRANVNMREVLPARYGEAFWERLTTEYVTDTLR